MELKEVYQNGFTKGNLEFMRGVLDQAFQNIENTTGVKMTIGNIRYENSSFKTQLTAVIPKAGEKGFDARELEYKKALASDGWKYGLTPDDFGRKSLHKGMTHILIGVAPKSRKYPIVVKREHDGQLIKMTKPLAKLFKIEK
jgi:hypothetical protein